MTCGTTNSTRLGSLSCEVITSQKMSLLTDLTDYSIYTWDVIDGLIRKKLSQEAIENLIKIKYNDGLQLVAEVWQIVAKATLTYADNLKKKEDGKSKNRLLAYKKFL